MKFHGYLRKIKEHAKMKIENILKIVAHSFAFAFLNIPSTVILAQEYPTKPIKMIVEYPAGAGGDVFLRTMNKYVSKELGQTIVVENKSGAGGLIASEAAANAPPDGYTLLAASSNPLLIRPYLSKSQSVDVFKDLIPVALIYNASTVILAHKSFPVNTLPELIAYTKSNPGKVFYATSGAGTVYHFIGEALRQMTGANMVHVPYKGGPASMQALMTGEVSIGLAFSASAVPAYNSGNVKVLALVDGKKFMGQTNIPEITQFLPGFEAPPSWTGLFMPANTPPAIVKKVNEAVVSALKSPDFPNFEGIEKVGSTSEQFAIKLREQYNLIGRIAKSSDIKPVE